MASVSLCMIVRDEEASLGQCLQSVREAVDEIVVVDTGSTDRTVEIAREHGARVKHLPWPEDFARARNAALDLVTGEWILVLDADEELGQGAAARVRQLAAQGGADGYLCRIVNLVGSRQDPDQEVSLGVRLFRRAPEYRYTGMVHEQLVLPPGARVAHGDFEILHRGYLDEILRERHKLERNVRLARRLVAAHPGDGLAHFQLATTLYRLGRYPEAVRSCRRALGQVPSTARPWVCAAVRTLVASLLEGGSPRRALEEASRWLEALPEYTDLVYLKGLALAALGRHAEALATFQRCTELGPAPVPPYSEAQAEAGSHLAWYMAGEMMRRLGQSEEAGVALRRALQLRPGWAAPLAAIADLVGPGDAPAILSAAAEGGLNAEQAARALAGEGRWEAALRVLEEAPPGTDPLFRATCLYHLGDPTGALHVLRRQEHLGRPQHPAAAGALRLEARCLWVLGRAEEATGLLQDEGSEGFAEVARAFLKEAEVILERLPQIPNARRVLARLRSAAARGSAAAQESATANGRGPAVRDRRPVRPDPRRTPASPGAADPDQGLALFQAAHRELATALSSGRDVAGALTRLASCLAAHSEHALVWMRQGFDLRDSGTRTLLVAALIRAGAPGLALQLLRVRGPAQAPARDGSLGLLEAWAACRLAEQVAEAGLATHPGDGRLEALTRQAWEAWQEEG